MKQWEAIDLEVGTKVKLTEKGKSSGMQGHAKTEYGTVAQKPRSPYLRVAVLKDGQKTHNHYHIDFWDLV